MRERVKSAIALQSIRCSSNSFHRAVRCSSNSLHRAGQINATVREKNVAKSLALFNFCISAYNLQNNLLKIFNQGKSQLL